MHDVSPCQAPCHHPCSGTSQVTGWVCKQLSGSWTFSCCALCRRAERQARLGARFRHRCGRPGCGAAGCAGVHDTNTIFKDAPLCFAFRTRLLPPAHQGEAASCARPCSAAGLHNMASILCHAACAAVQILGSDNMRGGAFSGDPDRPSGSTAAAAPQRRGGGRRHRCGGRLRDGRRARLGGRARMAAQLLACTSCRSSPDSRR